MKKTFFLFIALSLVFGLNCFAFDEIIKTENTNFDIFENLNNENNEDANKNEDKQDDEDKQLKAQDIIEVMPESRFISPKNQAIFDNKVNIKIEVKDASSIEFYLRRPESLLPKYAGRAQTKDNNIWELEFDTKQWPNGEYNLFPEITNSYGKYMGEVIGITIYNEIIKDTEKEEELIEKVTQTEKEVAIEEQAKEEEAQKSSEQIQTTIEASAEEAKDVVRNSEENLITPEMEKNINDNITNTEEDITEIAEKVEESEILKQKIKTKEEKKQDTEQNIKTTQKDLDKFSEDTLPLLVTEKEEELRSYQEQHKNIEQEINSCEEQLSDAEEKKKNLTNNLLTAVDEAIEPIEEIYGGQTNPQIEAIKTEAKNEIVEEIQRLESSVSEKTGAQIEKQEKLYRDSDNDGISDAEELRLKTDSSNPDTDGDGFLDGVEYAGGYDPLDPSPAEKIIYQDPHNVSPKKTDIYAVEQIKLEILPDGKTALKIKGKGLPNSFVTVYIFSEPIVLVVKTDKNGNWEYTLDKPLADGHHTIYATTTNNIGAIVAKSEPFVFAKNKDKVFRIFESVHLADVSSPVYALQKKYTILIGAVVFLNIILALFLIGVLTVKRKEV